MKPTRFVIAGLLGLTAAASALEWTATTSLPRGSWRHACAGRTGCIYFLGGGDGPQASCYFAPVLSGGGLGPWSATTALPNALGWFSADATEDHIYVCGGWNAGGLTNAVWCARLDTSGGILSWSAGRSLNSVLYTHGAVLVDSFLYLAGGATGIGVPVISAVRYARILGDGSLSDWTETAALPEPTRLMGLVAHDSFLYSVGGRNSAGQAVGTVWFSRRNPDGSLQSWAATAALPAGIDGMTCACVGDRVWSVGGYGAGSVNDVYSAQFNPDGSLGEWQAETPLPVARWAADGLALDGRVYNPGGYLSSGMAEVYYSSPLTGIAGDEQSPVAPGLQALVTRGSPLLRVTLQRATELRVCLFDVAGRSVWRLKPGRYAAGEHRLRLPRLSPGSYLCLVTAGPQRSTAKLVVPN